MPKIELTGRPLADYRRWLWFNGRMRRRSYWLLNLGLGGINLLIVSWSLFFPRMDDGSGISAWMIAVKVAGPAMGWLSLTAFVRRLHDIGLSGWWIMLPGAISLVATLAGSLDDQWVIRGATAAIVFLIALLDGTRGENRFGPDPCGRQPSAPTTGSTAGLVNRVDRWTITGLTLTGAGALFATFVAGPAGKLLPKTWMHRAGEVELADRVPERYRCRAPAASAALGRLAARLDPSLDVRIVFTSHPNVQGLAVPGGIVVIGQDVLRLAQSPAEVAGLMAHELAHVRLRHTEQMLTASLPLTLLPKSVFGVFASGVTASYSREREREADVVAVQTIARAGFDPRQFAVLLERIEQDMRVKRGRRNANVPSWLSTHPLTADRIAAIAKASPSAVSRAAMDDQDWAAIQAGCIGSTRQRARSRS